MSGPVGLALDIAAGKMYWTDFYANKIRRANLDGSDVEHLINVTDPHGIAIDPRAGKMYWCRLGKIRRADLDGSNIENLVTSVNNPREIALDPAHGKMYWTDRVTRWIQRANLDGSQVEVLVDFPVLWSLEGIALDIASGKMYWTVLVHGGAHRVQRANLDGSDIEDLVTTGISFPGGIALDPAAGKMYWTESANTDPGRIKRANLDGSNVEELLTAGLEAPLRIALDPTPCGGSDCQLNGVPDVCDICNGTSVDCNGNDTPDECELADGSAADCNGNEVPDECDLAGGASEDCCNDNGIPDECEPECDPAVVLGRVYWTGDGAINVATREGCLTQALIEGLVSPEGLALDFFAEKIYWADVGTSMIQRASLDGSNIEDLVTTGLESPTAVALDLVAKKMYWSDRGAAKIRRANLDGSGIEDVLASSANSIAFDIAAEKLYWSSAGRVLRANLDGSGIEELIGSWPSLQGIALDINARKLYWVVNENHLDGSGFVLRADFDSPTSWEYVVLEFWSPYIESIAIDPVMQKLYWAVLGVMARSDLDGSNVERDLAEGVRDIVVDPGCRGLDCQPNGIPDECDIASGLSADLDGNTVPDECELPPSLGASGGRYLSVTPAPIAYPIALRISSPTLPCLDKYVAASGALVDFPVFQRPADWGSVRVHGTEIIPETAYDIRTEFVAGSTSPPVRTTTARWGDTVGIFLGGEWTPPDGSVDITDAVAALDRFRALPSAPPIEWCDLEPQIPDGAINILDVVHILDAFAGLPYPFAAPCE